MNFPEPDYIEGTIYSGGFPSYRDQDLMKEFHHTDNLEQLIKISANIPEDIKSRYNDLINERVHTEGKWGSVDKALNEIEKLLDERNNKEDKAILVATKEQLLSMQK